ncbi:MAG TPA: hypothetical protein VF765_03955 [Polyangiaceae bacterium]
MQSPPPSSPTTPSVRARHLQRWLKNVAHEEDPWRGRFFAALSSDVREAIEGAMPEVWLPMAHHVLFADLMADAFGPARAHDYYRRDFVASLRRPPFASLVKTGARVLGITPAGFLRWSGRVYQAVFRAAGTAEGEVLGPGHGRLSYVGLPPMCTASDPWLDSAQGSLYGMYDFLGTRGGVVRLDKSRRAEGRLDLELEWTP